MVPQSLTDPIVEDVGEARPGGRIATLDILRGFALLGMILAHFHKMLGEGFDPTQVTSAVGRFIVLIVAEKDRTVFAFLFGVGLAIMMRQLERRRQPVVAICLRRCFVLYFVGFAVDSLTRFHILRDFAWWGIALVLLRNLPTRTLLLLAVLGASAVSIREVADSVISVARIGYRETVVAETAMLAKREESVRMQWEIPAETRYSQAVAGRIARIATDFPRLRTITPNEYLALFILGLLAVRHRVFEDPKRHLRLILGCMGAGALIWMVDWGVLSHLPDQVGTPRIAAQLRAGFGLLDEQCLAFTFIGGMTLLLTYWPRWSSVLSGFASAGRLALSNYIIQAVLIDYASSGYGLGLKIEPPMVLLGGLGLFVLQMWGSRLWLTRFRMGPIEWLWRSLTYWQRQPLRNVPAPSTATARAGVQ